MQNAECKIEVFPWKSVRAADTFILHAAFIILHFLGLLPR